MISIAQELDAHDIAQEIRQERQVHKGSFLLLAGERDIKRFAKFIDQDACSIQNCFGRDNLLGAIDILVNESFPGVLGLADAEFDRIEGLVTPNERVIFSESHDFDLDLVRTDVLRRYLTEVGHPDKCNEHGGAEGVRAWVLRGCKPLSMLRYIACIQNIRSSFDQMKRERDRFLPAPPEGEGALYGLGVENQNGWIGHNGNILSYMAYPYYLPAERITMVVLLNSGVDIPGSWTMMQDITRIISPNYPWPNLPKR